MTIPYHLILVSFRFGLTTHVWLIAPITDNSNLMIIKSLINVCCEENIFTLILSKSHIILHFMYVTQASRKSKTFKMKLNLSAGAIK